MGLARGSLFLTSLAVAAPKDRRHNEHRCLSEEFDRYLQARAGTAILCSDLSLTFFSWLHST
jgi:hypothetical protein